MVRMHQKLSVNVKYCHYYNNGKSCPRKYAVCMQKQTCVHSECVGTACTSLDMTNKLKQFMKKLIKKKVNQAQQTENSVTCFESRR